MSVTLYEGWVLDHSQSPHNAGRLDAATHSARCDNPLCGDRVTVDLVVEDGTIREVAFHARACAVAQASASILTTLVHGASTEHALALAERARAAVDPTSEPPTEPLEHLAIVRDVRARRRCATLAWEALQDALAQGEPA